MYNVDTCKIFADSESPVSLLAAPQLPPQRRLSAELRRVQSMRNFQRPFSLDPAIGAIGSAMSKLPMSKSFEADAMAALLKGEGNDDEKGKELSM